MKNYYTTGQAAKVLDVTIRTVQMWVDEGRISFWRTSGGHRRLDKNSVDALMQTPANESKQKLRDSNYSHHILLVDDSKADSRLIRKMILKVAPEAEIDEAEDGYEALLKIGHRCPDILFVDMEMPNINGFQMLESLSQHYAPEQTTVFVTTAYDTQELKSKGGIPDLVKHVFHKPIDMIEFLDTIKRYL